MDDLLARLDALAPGHAMFDLDGTLIAGDIGEATLRRRIQDGPLPPAARAVLGDADPWGAYEALAPVPQVIVAVQALAGWTAADLERAVDDAFATGEVAVRPEVAALAEAVGRRHQVWILTGSAELLGVACARRLGIRHVTGVRAVMDGPRITEEIVRPVSCSEGKVDVCRHVLGEERPVFAIGDSPWDVHVLRHAHVGCVTGKWALRGDAPFPSFPRSS
jgi:phosphoserine phosphatase